MSTLKTPDTGFLCDDVAPVVRPSLADCERPEATERPVLYGDKRSGNCLKVAKLIEYLGLDVEWCNVDLFEGETSEPGFLALNPFGKLPALRLSSGQVIAESNAILFELARGTDLEPITDAARAEIYQWLFWEASAFTPPLAQRRWYVSFVFKPEEDIDRKLLPKGNIALARLNEHLSKHDYAAGNRLSIADFSLFGYGHSIEEGGWNAADFPAVAAWVERVGADIASGDTSWQNSADLRPSLRTAS
jgi:glutathione S-transferase